MISSEAIAILRGIQELRQACECEQDVLALQELLPYLLSDDPDEVESAESAIIEIVSGEVGTVLPFFEMIDE